jgi:hypothetical protein
MSIAAETKGPQLWGSRWLRAAGIYNLAWGALAIASPHLLFDLTGAERINYPEIWQCVGMIVGVYGIGYLIAANDPRTHWPIVLVGLLGKVLGPIGFLVALFRGTFPPLFGLTILTNDLLWWIPFAMILWDAAKHRGGDLLTAPAMCSHYVKESRINASPEPGRLAATHPAMGEHETSRVRRVSPGRQSSRAARSNRTLADSLGRDSHGIRSTASIRGSPGIRTVRLLVSSPSVPRGWTGRHHVAGRGRLCDSAWNRRALARRLVRPA